MSRQSRIRKSTTPSTTTGIGLNLFFKRSSSEPPQVVAFWQWFGSETKRLAIKFPHMKALRHSAGPKAGEWVIYGGRDGEHAFRDLAIEAAQRIGYHGGPEGAVQFWLDHMNGDHRQIRKEKPINPNEVDFFTQNSTGERELHMGRYKQGGEMSTTAFERKPTGNKPMEVPRPITPTSLIIKP